MPSRPAIQKQPVKSEYVVTELIHIVSYNPHLLLVLKSLKAENWQVQL